MKVRRPTPGLVKQYPALYMETAVRFVVVGDLSSS